MTPARNLANSDSFSVFFSARAMSEVIDFIFILWHTAHRGGEGTESNSRSYKRLLFKMFKDYSLRLQTAPFALAWLHDHCLCMDQLNLQLELALYAVITRKPAKEIRGLQCYEATAVAAKDHPRRWRKFFRQTDRKTDQGGP